MQRTLSYIALLFMSPCVVAGVVLSCVCVLLGGGRRSWCGCVKKAFMSTRDMKAPWDSDHVAAPHVCGWLWRSRVITPFGVDQHRRADTAEGGTSALRACDSLALSSSLASAASPRVAHPGPERDDIREPASG